MFDGTFIETSLDSDWIKGGETKEQQKFKTTIGN